MAVEPEFGLSKDTFLNLESKILYISLSYPDNNILPLNVNNFSHSCKCYSSVISHSYN